MCLVHNTVRLLEEHAERVQDHFSFNYFVGWKEKGSTISQQKPGTRVT